MYETLDAHFLPIVIIVGSIMVALIYMMAVYVFSGASPKKGLQIEADFLSAFFSGFSSTQRSFQQFYPVVQNKLIMFPTGMIPLFLVPYAIFFHRFSLLNYRKFQRLQSKEPS
jgi:hypothetical protein